MKVKKPGSRLGLGLTWALAAHLIIGVTGAKAASPTEDVKSLISEVQTVLLTKSEKSQRLELIERLTAKHLDFEEIAQRSLGSTWNTLSSGQKAEFVRLLSQLLKASYANLLDEYSKAKVDYLGESFAGEGAEVRLVVVRPHDRIPLGFRLHQKGEGWMIYDLKVEGVSLVSNYRTKFQRAIQMLSYQGLLGRLKAHLKAEQLG